MRRVVVTGMGLVTPLGIGLERNWSSLVEGVSGVRAIQSFDVSDMTVKIAGQVARGETPAGLFNADDWVLGVGFRWNHRHFERHLRRRMAGYPTTELNPSRGGFGLSSQGRDPPRRESSFE